MQSARLGTNTYQFCKVIGVTWQVCEHLTFSTRSLHSTDLTNWWSGDGNDSDDDYDYVDYDDDDDDCDNDEDDCNDYYYDDNNNLLQY